jgi:hypothetical protein
VPDSDAVHGDLDARVVTFAPTTGPPTPVERQLGGATIGIACPATTQCTVVDQSNEEVTFDPTGANPNVAVR